MDPRLENIVSTLHLHNDFNVLVWGTKEGLRVNECGFYEVIVADFECSMEVVQWKLAFGE
jgi:hypothetical protein